MWFDAQAALKQLDGAQAPRSNYSFAPNSEPSRVADVASVARVEAQNSKKSNGANRADTDCRYGVSAGGRPLTYTGRVVSLEAWRNLADWEVHGPRGRHWCGITQKWIDTKGD